MIAVRATDVSLDTEYFSFKAIDDNNFMRLFPGLEDMQIAFTRCKF